MKDARTFANYKNTLARHNVIMLAVVGSSVLGLETSGLSDIDEMGICLEQPNQLLGFSPFEHEVYRTAEDRTGRNAAPSEPGDIDLTIYGLRKFVRMALSGNPNIMTLLYLPKNKFTIYTDIAADLQRIAPDFVSKEVGKAFLGYLRAQRMRLQGTRGQMRVNREEVIAEHGYDTKYAMHMVRLGMQGYEFMECLKLTFPMSADHRETLMRIRRGDTAYNDVIDQAYHYENCIKDYLDSNGVPDKPNYTAIERWLLATYERVWNENKKASQQQGVETDTQGQDAGPSKANRQEIEADIPF